ncbi:hypothetical protein NUSPORA_02838 [Nucleospora cyclopteri]
MEKIGKISRVEVPLTHTGTRNRGYAFVDFEEKKAMDFALKLNGKSFLGRTVVVEKAKPQTISKYYTLFVKNLPFTAGQEEIKNSFSKFGEISRISVPTDSENEGRNKGFAFVDFLNESSVQQALNSAVTLNKRRLYCSYGDKNDRRNNSFNNKRRFNDNKGEQKNKKFQHRKDERNSSGNSSNKIVFKDRDESNE